MMNFPTWPCNFPQKAEESKDFKPVQHNLFKKGPNLNSLKKDLNKDLSAFDKYKTIENIAKDPIAKQAFIESLDNYLSKLNKKLNLTKLAEGSFVMTFDLDDSYSKDGNIPFPKEAQKDDL
jgi:hypothetical protein